MNKQAVISFESPLAGRLVKLAPETAGSAAGNLSSGTVPDVNWVAFKLVIFEPLIAAAVPESCAAGKLVKDAPEPENVVAVMTPVTLTPLASIVAVSYTHLTLPTTERV